MLRKTIPIAVLLAALALGCEKKEPEAAPVRVVGPPRTAPAGMQQIQEGKDVFISRQPATVGQYVDYLSQTNQPLPQRWQDLAPDDPAAQQPVTGLTREEARRMAVWHMKRLPTPEEWEQAAAVGARPYPWAPDGAPVHQQAELFLVQDWLPAGPGQAEAARARGELVEQIRRGAAARVERLRAELQELVERQQARRGDLWEQIKPAFFSLLDKEKQLARLSARREGHQDVKRILTEIALAKGRLAAALKVEELSAEEADRRAAAYRQQLSAARAKVQEVREELQSETARLQDEVLALTRAFEEAGTAQATGLADQAEALLAETAETPETAAATTSAAERLEEMVARIRRGGPAFGAMPDLQEIEARAGEVERQTEELSGEDPAVEEVRALRGKVERFGEAIGREFLQESLLLQELDELVELRAGKKAVEATYERLAAVTGIDKPPAPEPTSE